MFKNASRHLYEATRHSATFKQVNFYVPETWLSTKDWVPFNFNGELKKTNDYRIVNDGAFRFQDSDIFIENEGKISIDSTFQQ